MDQQVIVKAKEYAKTHGTSLSKMIEAYFVSLTANHGKASEIETTPLVESLCGVIELPGDFDIYAARKKYLQEKHK